MVPPSGTTIPLCKKCNWNIATYTAAVVSPDSSVLEIEIALACVTIFIPSHTLFLWTILWILSYRNNDLLISWSYLLILSFDLIFWSYLLIISYLTDDLMFLYISSTCARHILWILLTCFRHVLHTAYTRHSFPMLRISCLQHALLMTYACSPCCLHAYFTI